MTAADSPARRDRAAFASDNAAGVLPAAWAAMSAANDGYALSYGHDAHTQALVEAVQRSFGTDTHVFPVATGTAANVLAAAGTCQRWNSVLAAEGSHLSAAECGAVEAVVGCKVIQLPTDNGKIRPAALELDVTRDEHQSQPALLSIAQSTERGTTYSRAELVELIEAAHARGLLVHIDGARILNAQAHLGCSLAELSLGAGADLLSLGGTKAGLLGAEALIVSGRLAADPFRYARMQMGHLVSKTRFAAAQLVALLEDPAVAAASAHANAMATRLALGLDSIAVLRTHPVEANLVHALPSPAQLRDLTTDWDLFVQSSGEVRFATSWSTEPQHVDALVGWLEARAGS